MSFSYDQLIEQYPDLFKANKVKISCGLGWFELISTLLTKIDSQAKYEEIDINVLQVKEKFGGLRFYIYDSDEYIDGAISLAESMSYHICENCGSSASNPDMMIDFTLCKKCDETI